MTQHDSSAVPPALLAVVAEDELMLQLLITETLRDEGFAVQMFGTADAALEYLEANHDKVNVVVSNVRMPGSIDGVRLAQIVTDRWTTVPFILMSGYAGVRDDVPVGVPFLYKPWTLDQLAAAVWKVVPKPTTNQS